MPLFARILVELASGLLLLWLVRAQVRSWLNRRFARRFARQLAFLLEADWPMLHGIEMLAGAQAAPHHQRLVQEVADRLSAGEALHRAFADIARLIPGDFTRVIAWSGHRGNPADLIVALRLLAGDTSPRPAAPAATPSREADDQDVFARRLRG